MSLELEIKPYLDGNGLVCPDIQGQNPNVRGSDNGPLFTSQYLILQKLNGETPDTEALVALFKCIGSDGQIHRAPNDTSEDAPDDNYGFLAAMNVLGITATGYKLPLKCMHPALIYLRALANGSILARLWSPLIALIILSSNLNTPKSDTSNRLLTWTLIQGARSKSLLCNIAGEIWTYRQYRIYGTNPVSEIFRIYMQQGHPFVRYSEGL